MTKASPMTDSNHKTCSQSVDTIIDHVRQVAADWFADAETSLVAVVLGSGLGGLVDSIECAATIPFDEIPGLSAATASGHRGEFLLGRFAGVRIITMAGRLHAYEGHGIDALSRGMALLAGLQPDAVIVSTFSEVVWSSRAGLRTIAIGVVTNMAVPDAPATASHDEVLAISSRAGAKLQRIVAAIAASLGRNGPQHEQPHHVGNGLE